MNGKILLGLTLTILMVQCISAGWTTKPPLTKKGQCSKFGGRRPGWFGPDEDDFCRKCREEEVPTEDHQGCRLCERHTVPDPNNPDSCIPIGKVCAPEQIFNKGTCKTCASGKYPAENRRSCTFCRSDKNMYVHAGICKKCPNGAIPREDQMSCKYCHHDTEIAANGRCVYCQIGTVPNPQATRCIKSDHLDPLGPMDYYPW